MPMMMCSPSSQEEEEEEEEEDWKKKLFSKRNRETMRMLSLVACAQKVKTFFLASSLSRLMMMILMRCRLFFPPPPFLDKVFLFHFLVFRVLKTWFFTFFTFSVSTWRIEEEKKEEEDFLNSSFLLTHTKEIYTMPRLIKRSRERERETVFLGGHEKLSSKSSSRASCQSRVPFCCRNT